MWVSGVGSVEVDTEVLVVLLAVRALGGQQVSAAAPVLKGLKNPLQRAKDQGLVAARTVEMPAHTKAGKATKKKVPVVDITDKGDQLLRQSADPMALEATARGQVMALRQNLEGDRQALRGEVLAAVSVKKPGKIADPSKEVAAISKTLGDLASRVAKLEASLQNQASEPLVAHIDRAFDGLLARLDRALHQGPAAAAPAPPSGPATAKSLEAVLREAYCKLRQFIEFEDGIVQIPRLYHEARRALPGLSVEVFRRELERLWDAREVELKVLNEVRTAAEPDKAVRRGDNLYYFLYWPKP
jgi:hypothetical protein